MIVELFRIIFIFAILGMLGWVILENIYAFLGIYEENMWPGGLAILLLVFVLYRNKWQFSGWYQGKGREKLPKTISKGIILCSIVLFLTPCVEILV